MPQGFYDCGMFCPLNKKDLSADLIAVESDPSTDIKNNRKTKFVIKNGVIYKKP
jgi:imidazolonepropionase-like amidohydrolase